MKIFTVLLRTNVSPIFSLPWEAVKRMIEEGKGSIINNSSMASQYGIPKAIAYISNFNTQVFIFNISIIQKQL